jgi:hypothetical protein
LLQQAAWTASAVQHLMHTRSTPLLQQLGLVVLLQALEVQRLPAAAQRS